METHLIITAIPKFKDKFLILHRNPDRRTSPNKWAFVSGYIKEFESAESCALRELKEETGLDGEVLKTGNPVIVENNFGRWVVIPVLVEVNSTEVDLCREEHSEFAWVLPSEINRYDCVEGLDKDLKAVGLL